jgi:putative hydrolase of the HAD superfamily
VSSDIEAVLFDFGGVFTGSPFAAVEAAGARMGAQPGQLFEIMFGSYGVDGDHPWHQMERGELSFSETRERIIALGAAAGLEFEPIEVLAGSGALEGAREVLVERVRRLRADGYRTAIVTNNVKEFSDRWRRMLPVDELFELVVDSSEVGIRKPDPRIYEITLERMGGLAPERAVFLDDFETNVEAARQLGLHGIHVGEDIGHAIRELDALLAS